MNEQSRLLKLSISAKLKFLLKDSMLYGLANALNATMLLFLFPILARELQVEDFGLFDLIITGITSLTLIVIFGQDSAVARFFYDNQCQEYRTQVVSCSLFMQFIVCVCSFLLILLFRSNLSLLTPFQIDKALLYLAALQIPCFMLINFSQNILKWTFKRTEFLVVSLGNTFVTLILTYAFVKLFNFGIVGALSSFSISRFCFALLGLFFVRRWLSFSLSLQYIKPLLNYAIPYGIICVLSSLTPLLERYFVDDYFGSLELGYYAAAAKVAMIVSLIIYAFQTAWGPFYLSIYVQHNSSKVFNLVLTVFTTLILIVVTLSVILGEYIIILLAGNEYANGADYVGYIALGLGTYSIATITGIGIDIKKKPQYKLFGYIIAFMFFLFSTPLWISKFGGIGIVLSLTVTYLIRFIIESYLSNKLIDLQFGVIRCVIFVVLFSVTFFGANYLLQLEKLEFGFLMLVIIFSYVFYELIYKQK